MALGKVIQLYKCLHVLFLTSSDKCATGKREVPIVWEHLGKRFHSSVSPGYTLVSVCLVLLARKRWPPQQCCERFQAGQEKLGLHGAHENFAFLPRGPCRLCTRPPQAALHGLHQTSALLHRFADAVSLLFLFFHTVQLQIIRNIETAFYNSQLPTVEIHPRSSISVAIRSLAHCVAA